MTNHSSIVFPNTRQRCDTPPGVNECNVQKQCGLSGNASKEAYAETYSESDAHDGQTSRECNDYHSGHIVLDVINRTRESRFHRFCQHRFSPFPHCFP
jgi:hypothetical protein